MVLLRAVLLLGLTGCMVGDEPEEEIGASFSGASVAGNSLRWDGFTSNCVHLATGVTSIGSSLTVLFDNGDDWSSCTFSGVVHVPAGVRISAVRQQLRTSGDAAVRYSASVGGSQVTSQSTSRTVFVTAADISAYGARLCGSTGATAVKFSFTVTASWATTSLDSVDWAIDAAPCH